MTVDEEDELVDKYYHAKCGSGSEGEWCRKCFILVISEALTAERKAAFEEAAKIIKDASLEFEHHLTSISFEWIEKKIRARAEGFEGKEGR